MRAIAARSVLSLLVTCTSTRLIRAGFGLRSSETVPRGSDGIPPIPEGERSVAALLRLLGFDAHAYKNRSPDLQHLSDQAALTHYVEHGRREGRAASFTIGLTELMERLSWLQLDGCQRSELKHFLTLSTLRPVDTSADLERVKDLITAKTPYRPFIIIGDSHSRFFYEPSPYLENGLMPVPFLCSGGSARGLANPKSKSGYRERILLLIEDLARSGREPLLVFKFGQVDVEFVDSFKRVAEGRTEFQMASTLEYYGLIVQEYLSFLVSCRDKYGGKIVVSSIFPPTLSDAMIREGYVNAHIGFLHSETELTALSEGLAKLEFPDLRMRTELHRNFNALLKQGCLQLGFDYLDEFDGMLGDNHMVAPAIAGQYAGTDHHVDFDAPATRERMALAARTLKHLIA